MVPLIENYVGGVRLSVCYRTSMAHHWSTFSYAAFEDHQFNDVTLEVNGGRLSAHRLVLSSTSPVFEAMFRHNFRERLSGNVELSDSFSCIKRLGQFLYFLYKQWLCVDLYNVPELLGASTTYFTGNLTELCSQYLFTHLRPSNCLETWLMASLYCLNELEFVCRHLFSEVFPFVKIQKRVVTSLPSWFIVTVLMKSNLPEIFPILLPTLVIVWFLGNVEQRESTVLSIFVQLRLSDQTVLTVFNNLCLNPTERTLIKTVLSCVFVFTAGDKNKPTGLHSRSLSNNRGHQVTAPKRNPRQNYLHNRQHLCVMLLNKNNTMAAFYCIEHQKWRTLHLPFYNGIVLGIIAGNILVRVVKGSSANLFNISTGKSTQTPCVLNVLAECKMDVAFLPAQSNFFLAIGYLHVALVIRKFRSFQLVIFRFNHRSNRWSFRMGFPLFHILNQVVLRAYSTRHSLVYLVVTVRPYQTSLHVQTEFSHVFVLDILRRVVLGSTCGYFGNRVLNNDCFILMNNLHVVTNRRTLLGHQDKSPTSARVLVIDPKDHKYLHILFTVWAPKLERPPIISTDRKDYTCTESLSTVKESLLCLFHHMGPYISTMFIFDIERRQWTQTPPPPPIFKQSPSKPVLIYTYESISTLLPEADPSVISKDENFFREWQLG